MTCSRRATLEITTTRNGGNRSRIPLDLLSATRERCNRRGIAMDLLSATRGSRHRTFLIHAGRTTGELGNGTILGAHQRVWRVLNGDGGTQHGPCRRVQITIRGFNSRHRSLHTNKLLADSLLDSLPHPRPDHARNEISLHLSAAYKSPRRLQYPLTKRRHRKFDG